MTKEAIKLVDKIFQDQPHRVCPDCQHLWSPKTTYCGYCGSKLGAIKNMDTFKINKLTNCHDCNAPPGEVHTEGCDTERCSQCGGQRLCCNPIECKNHDPGFSRWTGIWPGKAEADYFGVDLNEFEVKYSRLFFIKPQKN